MLLSPEAVTFPLNVLLFMLSAIEFTLFPAKVAIPPTSLFEKVRSSAVADAVNASSNTLLLIIAVAELITTFSANSVPLMFKSAAPSSTVKVAFALKSPEAIFVS